jgi:biopolymer transport protein ExbB
MRRWIALACAATSAALVFSPLARSADTLEELLEQTRRARTREAQINSEREKEFQADRARQAQLLAQAERERAEAERQSQQLSARYDANEKQITEFDEQLKARSGDLGELFGVTRQIAGDAASALSQSLISSQYPEREEFLRELAAARALPSSEELRQLWFELQREMTESGRVVRLQTEIVQPSGETVQQEVVRVGPFTALASDGRYLAYLPSQKKLTVLPRQPEDLHDVAVALGEARSGTVRTAVDPARGALLALRVERPGLVQRIEEGEFVGYVILLVGGIGLIAALYQFAYLILVRFSVNRQLRNLERPAGDNPLGRVLLSFKGDPRRIEEQAEVAELRISEAVLREVPRLERFQAFLRLAVAAGPLLGLVGTVIGMIITFQSITESGSSDPKLMAEGIGQAMIATVLGLGIAIPLLFINAGLAALSRSVVQILDEQSTGLLAESIERKNGSATA